VSARPLLAPRGCSIEERFWKLVDSSGGPDACWPWLRARDKDGYGKVQVSGKTVRASRLAFKLKNGRYPEGLGLHSCDHPWCCNPSHIEDLDELAAAVREHLLELGMPAGAFA
jgi:hypothetical protein